MEKERFIKFLKKGNRGVSIIALAITIGVLLTLTGVAISSLQGNDGLISSAENVRNTLTEGEKQDNMLISGLTNWIEDSVNLNQLPVPGEGEGQGGEVHFHFWQIIRQTNASCENAGIQYLECSCGEKKEKAIAPLGHLWGERQVVQNSTCTVKGTAKYICTRCSKEKTEETAIISHDFSKQEPTATYLKSEATCEKQAEYYYRCQTCTESSKSTTGAFYKYGSVVGHNYDGGKITTEPTCDAEGVKTYTCSNCGNSYTEVIAAIGHNYDGGKITTEPTCDAEGVKTYTCSNCGNSYTEAIVAVGHNYDEGKITTEPSCDKEGVKTFTCANCGNTYTEAIAAVGHNYDEGKITTEPSCDKEGVKTFTCANCGNTYTEAIAAKGHTEVNGGTEDAHIKCSVCGEVLSTEHSFAEEVTKEANCIETGIKTFTCDCGYTYTEDIAVLGHNYSSVVTAPTCTEKGYTTYTCSRCSDTYTDNEVAATGHTEDSGTLTKQATCTETGTKIFKCTVCGEEIRTESINALGHTEVNGGNLEAHTKCSVCGEILSTVHSYKEEITKEANCTEKGSKTFTCDCGYIYTEDIAVLGHNYSSVITAPTCTEKGYTTYTCSRCSDTYTDNEVAATGHNYTSQITKAPTCGAKGVRTYTCTKCSASYTEDIQATEAHTWNEGVITIQPTTTTYGERTYTCTVCSQTKTETIEKLPEDTSGETISKEQSYVGYYANLDEDEEPEGIIYADLAIETSGQWGTTDNNKAYGAFSYGPVTGTKDYYISTVDHPGTFGIDEEDKKRDVITVVSGSTGADRFYVMALEDVTTADYTTFYWYYSAYTNKINDYSTKTSNDFEAGKTNTANMIAAWEAEDYGTQSTRDMWGVIQEKVAEGWFVPSRGEWGAFASNLGITKDNRTSYGLPNYCWSSSLLNASSAWYAGFDYGYVNGNRIYISRYVRLSATF